MSIIRTTAWTQNFIKPKDEQSLYNLEIINPQCCDIIKGFNRSVIVRDCRYDKKLDQFTQIDDESTFERKEILMWQKHYKNNDKEE